MHDGTDLATALRAIALPVVIAISIGLLGAPEASAAPATGAAISQAAKTGRIQAGVVSNEIVSGLDWRPTRMAAVGDPHIKDKLLKGYHAGTNTFKVHLDGYNQLAYLTGQQPRSARKEFIYFNDDGDLVALRYENWKVVFEEQRATGTMRIWAEPFTKLRVPKVFDLRADPYERADITSNTYYDWVLTEGVTIFTAAQPLVATFLATFKEYPPSQRPSSFSIDQIVEKMQRSFEAAQSR